MTAQTDTIGLTFRQNYFADPAGWNALSDLLQDTFHIDIRALDNLGGMEPSSMPFAWFDADGICAANFSAFSMPMMVNGQRRKVAALQSGAVRPQHRGKGLYRDLMQRAFEWIDAEAFDLAILYTDKPAMYEPYGFKTVPLHKFTGPAPNAGKAGAAHLLSMDDETDVALPTRLIKSRAPGSALFSPLSHPAMFLVNAFWDRSIRLSLLEDADAVIAWRLGETGVFQLLDIVARVIPPLSAIAASLEPKAASVECFFSPDRLDWQGAAIIDENRLPFMVRGDFSLLPSQPFALTPMADF
jgi:GNAT superfamily N-acetyltransferase